MPKSKSLLDPFDPKSSLGTMAQWLEDKYKRLENSGLTLVETPTQPAKIRLSLLVHDDGLVHSMLGLYDTKWVVGKKGEAPWPVEGITDCGISTLVKSTGYTYDCGLLVPDQALTCMRCICGDGEGLAARQAQKTMLFAQRYGATGRTLDSLRSAYVPPMQQIPRKR